MAERFDNTDICATQLSRSRLQSLVRAPGSWRFVKLSFWFAPAAFWLLIGIVGCDHIQTDRSSSLHVSGNSERGQQLISTYGCGECHEVPGVKRARGRVGPPLSGFGNRSMIAGELVNSPENLTRWIRTPEAVRPNTAMPNLSVTQQDAKDIGSYLYTLRD
jgi:cytochrome c2